MCCSPTSKEQIYVLCVKVFGSLKLAPIKYEKSFVPRHINSDEGLFESLLNCHNGKKSIRERFSEMLTYRRNHLKNTKYWKRSEKVTQLSLDGVQI